MKIHSILTLKNQAFTLIELLVVILIISMLGGLLMPSFQGIRETAKKTKAQVTINNLSIALKAYYNEYGTWPNKNTSPYTADTELSPKENQYLYQILSGVDISLDGTPGGNSRKIAFYEFKKGDLGPVGEKDKKRFLKDPKSPITNLIDPWGNAFRISFDYDGDNIVSLPPEAKNPAGGFTIWTQTGTSNKIISNWQ